MHPTHDTALAARIGILQARDLLSFHSTCRYDWRMVEAHSGALGLQYTHPCKSNFLSSIFIFLFPITHVLALLHQNLYFIKGRLFPKLRCLPSLKQPFGSLLLQISKIYKTWKASLVVSLFFMDLHLFFMLPLLHPF